jgi:hypothetical protein
VPGCLYYFCGRNHAYPLGIFAAFYARKIAPAIRIIPYQTLGRIDRFGPGAYIFTDLDRMTAPATVRLRELIEPLKAAGRLVLNDPARVLGRFDLLKRLHGTGLNAFNVHRIGDWKEVRRFPVFIRHENSHKELVTDLIEDPAALGNAIGEIADEADAGDLMIVEFGNVPGADGRFRKYSAYRVGETIYPQHCFSSPQWWIKFDADDMGEEQVEEHLGYVEANPHRDQLATVFDLAGIEYGRIDYCVVDGRVQTFEINTNPTVLQGRAHLAGDMTPYARLHENALLRLLAQAPERPDFANPLLAGGEPAISAEAASEEMIGIIRQGWLEREAALAGVSG